MKTFERSQSIPIASGLHAPEGDSRGPGPRDTSRLRKGKSVGNWPDRVDARYIAHHGAHLLFYRRDVGLVQLGDDPERGPRGLPLRHHIPDADRTWPGCVHRKHRCAVVHGPGDNQPDLRFWRYYGKRHSGARLVAPSIDPGSNLQQTQIVPLIEGELSKGLRKILHDADFQAIEAAWRGIDFLIRGTGDQIKSYLIDITKSELTAMLAGGDLPRTTIFKQLQEIGPAIVLGIYTFGLQDQSLLKALGALAQAHHTAFVAGASPEMVGCSSFGSQPDPDDWVHGPGLDGLDALRRMSEAAYLGLLMPRFLLRQPYGAGSDPIETFPFEEMLSQPEHESYLWGSSAILCGYLLADAFATDGRELDTRQGGEIFGLPMHKFTADGEIHVKPCAEAWLSDKAADAILNRGIMPVASIRGRDAVEIQALRAFSLPPKPLPIRYG